MTVGILRLFDHIQEAGLSVAGWAAKHNKTPVSLFNLAKLADLRDFVDPNETRHEDKVVKLARMRVWQEL